MAFAINSSINNIITISNNFGFKITIKELWGNFQPLPNNSNIYKFSTDITLSQRSYQTIADFNHLLIVPEALSKMRSKEMNFFVFDDVEESVQILINKARMSFNSQQ